MTCQDTAMAGEDARFVGVNWWTFSLSSDFWLNQNRYFKAMCNMCVRSIGDVGTEVIPRVWRKKESLKFRARA
jgi:hypothetical protein